MRLTILILLLNSIVLSMVGGNTLSIPSFWLLFPLGILNLGLTIFLYQKHEVFWIITAVGSVVFFLVGFAHTPLWLQLPALLILVSAGNFLYQPAR